MEIILIKIVLYLQKEKLDFMLILYKIFLKKIKIIIYQYFFECCYNAKVKSNELFN